MSSVLVSMFDMIQKAADDPKLNAAIKKSKDFRALAANLVLWLLPIALAYGLRRLESGLKGAKA